MKNKHETAVCAAALAAIALFAFWHAIARGESREFTLTAAFSDGSRISYAVETTERFLGPALRERGLIEGEAGEEGFEIVSVAGQSADASKGEGWRLYKGEDELEGDIDRVRLRGGDAYILSFTSPMIEEGLALANSCTDCA
ncbi:MAG: hypothetical protein Q4B42_01585 [Oscillospiraceae bacterium]|nr:hypothetical protein [Oscillospiraceae bacterium]